MGEIQMKNIISLADYKNKKQTEEKNKEEEKRKFEDHDCCDNIVIIEDEQKKIKSFVCGLCRTQINNSELIVRLIMNNNTMISHIHDLQQHTNKLADAVELLTMSTHANAAKSSFLMKLVKSFLLLKK